VEQTILTQDLTRALPRRPDQAGCGARCPDALLTAAGGVLPSESR